VPGTPTLGTAPTGPASPGLESLLPGASTTIATSTAAPTKLQPLLTVSPAKGYAGVAVTLIATNCPAPAAELGASLTTGQTVAGARARTDLFPRRQVSDKIAKARYVVTGSDVVGRARVEIPCGGPLGSAMGAFDVTAPNG